MRNAAPPGAPASSSSQNSHATRRICAYLPPLPVVKLALTPAPCSIPHYAPKSKSFFLGRFTRIANYLRSILIEDIYGRLSKLTRHALLGNGDHSICYFFRYHVPRR